MMKMTIFMASVLALAGICPFGLAQSSPVTGSDDSTSTSPGYTITLTQPSNPISLKSSIQVTMTIKNITGGDVLWRAVRSTNPHSWHSGFSFLLKKNGEEIETTFFHRKMSGRQRANDPVEVLSESTILLPKPPGTMFVHMIDLKRIYQITEPGQYTLDVSRMAEDDKTIVHSNTITLNIVP
jgi:hypothetical protein